MEYEFDRFEVSVQAYVTPVGGRSQKKLAYVTFPVVINSKEADNIKINDVTNIVENALNNILELTK